MSAGFREARVLQVQRELGCDYREACRELGRRGALRRAALRRAQGDSRWGANQAALTPARESWATRWERAQDER